MAMAMATDPPAVVNNYARGSELIRAGRARGGAGNRLLMCVDPIVALIKRKSALVL